MKNIGTFVTIIGAAILIDAAAHSSSSSHAPAVSLSARTIAPAAGMTNQAAGASYIAPATPDIAQTSAADIANSVSLAKRGGDLQSSRVPRETEQDAQAPAGSSSPVGAFVSHESPPACQCGENCPCRLKSTAVAERPAPAMPVPAPSTAVPYTVPAYYQPYRPTFTGYYQSGCGPGGCSPSGFRVFRRGR